MNKWILFRENEDVSIEKKAYREFIIEMDAETAFMINLDK